MYHPSKKNGENKDQALNINIEELLDMEELSDQEAMAVVGGDGGTTQWLDKDALKMMIGGSGWLDSE